MSRHPFGLDHATWARPTNFLYDTAEAARVAVERAYGQDSGHVVVGPVAQARAAAVRGAQ